MSDEVRRLRAGPHAAQRMAERGITIEMIRAVVGNPDVTSKRSDGCAEYVKTLTAGRLKVVVDEERNPAFIVTVHWT